MLFLTFFACFPRILGIRPRERILAIFVGFFLVFFFPKRQGTEDQGSCLKFSVMLRKVLWPEWGRAKGAEKASCGETVVQKGVFGESVSSLPP